jgi:molybdopterin-guanine dinucleotide biosynthesis protein A
LAPGGLTGILLVGGASRRLGSPKALAELDGATLAERAWRTLGEACDERVAVGKAADDLRLPFELLDDGTRVRAPIAGLVAGLPWRAPMSPSPSRSMFPRYAPSISSNSPPTAPTLR